MCRGICSPQVGCQEVVARFVIPWSRNVFAHFYPYKLKSVKMINSQHLLQSIDVSLNFYANVWRGKYCACWALYGKIKYSIISNFGRVSKPLTHYTSIPSVRGVLQGASRGLPKPVINFWLNYPNPLLLAQKISNYTVSTPASRHQYTHPYIDIACPSLLKKIVGRSR